MQKYSQQIEKVAAARARYKALEFAIDAEARYKKDAAKAPVIQAINEALAAGASKNSVAIQGMGYTGIAPMNSFMAVSSSVVPIQPVDLPDVKLPYREKQDSTDPSTFYVIDDETNRERTVHVYDGTVSFPYIDEDLGRWYYEQHVDEYTFKDSELERLGISR